MQFLSILRYWTELTGRLLAAEGLERLRSGAGYPVSMIFDDAPDREIFVQLEKRISKRTTSKKIKEILGQGTQPSLISVAGQPVLLIGVPDTWDQKDKCVYLSAHPVLYCFGATRTGGKGKADKACSIGELEKWLSDEKENRKFVLGAIVLGILSATFIVLRLVITS